MNFLKLKWIFLTLILAVFIHFISLFLLPRLIMNVLGSEIVKRAKSENKFHFQPMVFAGNDKIVRTSPDLLYASMVYNVSDKPLHCTFYKTKLDNYWSASFYEGKTGANVFTFSDKKVKEYSKAGAISLIIKKQEDKYQAKENEEVVNVENPKGVLLYRMLLPNREDKKQVDSLNLILKKAFTQ